MGGPGSGRKKGSGGGKKLRIKIAGGKSEKRMMKKTADSYNNDPRVKAARAAAAARKSK